MKLTKTLVTGSVLSLAFLANCDLIFGPDWKYGDAEMRAAVEGTWKLTRDSQEITLIAKQASSAKQSARGFVKSAAACGSRSFIKEAAACADVSRMPLELVAEGHQVSGGELTIGSTTFTRGELRFEIDGGYVEAEVEPTGAIRSAFLYAPTGKDQPYNKQAVLLKRVAK